MKIKKITKRILLTLASTIALGTLGAISANYNPVNAIIETTQELTEAKNNEKDVIKKLAKSGTIYCAVDYTVVNNSPKSLHIKIKYSSIADLKKKIATELQKEANVNPEIYEVVFDGITGKSTPTLVAEVAQRPKVSSQSTSQLTAQFQKEIAEELQKLKKVTCHIQTPMNTRKFKKEFQFSSVDSLKRKILALVSSRNKNQDLSDYEVVFKDLNSTTKDLQVVIKEKASTTTKSKDQSSSQESSTDSKKSSVATDSTSKTDGQSASQILTEDSEDSQLPDLPNYGTVWATIMYADYQDTSKSYLPQKTKITYRNLDGLKDLALNQFASKNKENPENYVANLVRYNKKSNIVTIEITENPVLSQLPATGTVNLRMFYVDENSNQKQPVQTSKIDYDNVLDLNEGILDLFAEKNNNDPSDYHADFVRYNEKTNTLIVSISDAD